MKKYLAIILIFTISLGAFFFYRSSGNKTVTGPGSSTSPAFPDVSRLVPSFPPPASGSTMSYTATIPSSAFPASLPLYTVGIVDNKTSARKAASALGFKAEPVTSSGGRGVQYVWNESGASLAAGGTPLEIHYSSGKTASGTMRATTKELGDIAQRHITLLGLPEDPYKTTPVSVSYFTLSGFDMRKTNIPAEATIIELSYQYNLENRPFFSGKPNEPGIKIRINSQKEIISSVIIMPPPLSSTNTPVDVVTIQEGVARLTRGEGVIVDLYDKESVDFSAPQYNATNGVVKETILGYYWGAGQETVVLVYLFRGSAPDTETGAELTFATIVSALPTNQ